MKKKEEKAMEDLLSFSFCQLNQARAKMKNKIEYTHTRAVGSLFVLAFQYPLL